MKNYTHILFDADNTLFDFNLAEKTAVKMTFKSYGYDIDDEICDYYHNLNDVYWKKLEKKEITQKELSYKRFEEMFTRYGYSLDPSAFNASYKENLGKQNFLIKNAETTLNYLKGLGKILIIASNGSKSVQFNRIKTSKIASYIDFIYTSEDAGITKPNRMFFDKLFDEYKLNKDTSLLVGDSESADILGGYNYNIDTVYFNPIKLQSDIATYNIDDLLQLKNIIK